MEPNRSLIGAIVVAIAISGCVEQEALDGPTKPKWVDADAEIECADSFDDEHVGESREELTKGELCYKCAYGTVKFLCMRTHTPADVCHHIADSAATKACERFQGTGHISSDDQENIVVDNDNASP